MSLPAVGLAAAAGLLLVDRGQPAWVPVTAAALVSAVVAVPLMTLALRLRSNAPSGESVGATVVACAAVVALCGVLARSEDSAAALGLWAPSGMVHVALAGLAWPGLAGVLRRVVVAVVVMVPATFGAVLSFLIAAALVGLLVPPEAQDWVAGAGFLVSVACVHVVVLALASLSAAPASMTPGPAPEPLPQVSST